MLTKEIKSIVAGATVKLLGLGGQGVLVGNRLIVTAAHCVQFSTTGAMALGDWFIQEIESVDGRKFRVTPYAVEPVNDIAILGALDDQAFGEDVEAFEAFCESTTALVLRDEFPIRLDVPVFIYSHKREWISGEAKMMQEHHPRIGFKTKKGIEGGTSGGPIVDENGNLVAVVSQSGSANTGFSPFVKFALPVWISEMISSHTRAAHDSL